MSITLKHDPIQPQRLFVIDTTTTNTTAMTRIKTSSRTIITAQLRAFSPNSCIYLLSYNIIVARTTNWRTKQTIHVVLKTWPNLWQCSHYSTVPEWEIAHEISNTVLYSVAVVDGRGGEWWMMIRWVSIMFLCRIIIKFWNYEYLFT